MTRKVLIIRQDNDEAAKWRLRVERRDNIFEELMQIGSCPALMCGSLLVLPNMFGTVSKLESYTHWRETLENSPLFNRLDKDQQKRLAKLGYRDYTRLEDGLNCLGRVLALACEEQSDRMMLEALAELKLWAVKTTLQKRSSDAVIAYLKWVAKAAQAAFLQSSLPELPEVRPGIFLGQVLPFAGPIRFISDLILGRRDRSSGITLEEGRSLAQMASLGRALPYPSESQIKSSVEETIELIKEPSPPIEAAVRERYREGLHFIATKIDRKVNLTTHISLAGSGSLESSRSEGGRGADLVRLAKPICNLIITDQLLSVMEGKRDVFGFIPISMIMSHAIRNRMATDSEKKPRLGHFLYQLAADMETLWEFSERTDRPPGKLPEVLNLVCSADLLDHGRYRGKYEVIHGMLLFDKKANPEFIPDVDCLPVKADVSVEAGVKTRLVTSALTSYVHFGQQVGHILRAYLRNDPFLQVGFEEPDKLWQVLKQYRRAVFKTDLKE
jgi:hypothetical protein